MRVFHFLNHQFGLKDIRERRLKVSRITDLNDPFEFLGVELSNRSYRRGLQKVKAKLSEGNGLLCFTKDWHNPVLWGHYADKHRGLCLGFDVPDENLGQVSYVNTRFQWPPELDKPFVKRLLFTKFAHWSYEDEYRAYVSLDQPENGLYYADFSNALTLRQVIVGPESPVTRLQVEDALGNLKSSVEVFKACAAFKSFRVVRNKNVRMWA